MPLRKPAKSEWRAYCDRLSKNLANVRPEPVTASLVVNQHGVAEWVPLLGIAYEPKKDLFEICCRISSTGFIARRRSMSTKGPRESLHSRSSVPPACDTA